MGSREDGLDTPTEPIVRWGGACLIVVAILFALLIFFSLALSSSLQDLYPTTPLSGSGLDTLAQHAALARTTFALGMLSDLFLIPGIVALYAALNRLDRGAMRVASLFMGLYVILDLAVSGMNVAALVSVSQAYASGTPTAQQSSFAVASYIKAVISLSLPISSACLSVGVLLISLVLQRGPLGRPIVYLGIASGIVGLFYGLSAAVPGLTGLQGLSAILELAWFAVMGWKLVRLDRPSNARPQNRGIGAHAP
jgi:hypothetical protein